LDQTLFFNIDTTGKSSLNISLLSATVGLENGGLYQETYSRGILGAVKLGSQNIREGNWYHQVGLKGESLRIPSDPSKVKWTPNWDSKSINTTLAWYKATFRTPQLKLSDRFALDMKGMNKGSVWINGKQIGRYWLIIGHDECKQCDYAGPYDPSKCRVGCGDYSQRYYHVPIDWISITEDNTIIILEELGGDPNAIKFVNVTRA